MLYSFCYAGWRCLVCLPAADFFSVCCHWIPFSIAKSRSFGNISLSSLIFAPSLAALFRRRLISFITSRSTVALCELSLCSNHGYSGRVTLGLSRNLKLCVLSSFFVHFTSACALMYACTFFVLTVRTCSAICTTIVRRCKEPWPPSLCGMACKKPSSNSSCTTGPSALPALYAAVSLRLKSEEPISCFIVDPFPLSTIGTQD